MSTPFDTPQTYQAAPADDRLARLRPVVSFVSRAGRLNQVQKRAWDAHHEQWFWRLDQIADLDDGRITAPEVFGRSGDVVVEIGSGMGESTAAMAQALPEINLLAVEVYKPGIAQTFHHLAKRGVDNVRLLRADAVTVLTDHIKPGSLAQVWLFFPDPWPKRRHHKRRLVTAEFAALVASRLRKGGIFRMATDWEPYAEQMLAVGTGTKGLRNAHPGWAPRPGFRPLTKFERRGRTEGREIFDLEFVRR